MLAVPSPGSQDLDRWDLEHWHWRIGGAGRRLCFWATPEAARLFDHWSEFFLKWRFLGVLLRPVRAKAVMRVSRFTCKLDSFEGI